MGVPKHNIWISPWTCQLGGTFLMLHILMPLFGFSLFSLLKGEEEAEKRRELRFRIEAEQGFLRGLGAVDF